MSGPTPDVGATGTELDPDAIDADATDPNDRVHHHARNDGGRRGMRSNVIVTLCGLRLSGKRPDAGSLPCCPMCNAEMGALGRRCD